MNDLLSTLEQLNEITDPEDLPEINRERQALGHMDKLRISQSFPTTEYGSYLGRHYLAAGYSSSEAYEFLDMLAQGREGVLPYLVIPLRGGNLPWLESTSRYLDSTPAQTLGACLKIAPSLSILDRYVKTLHRHVEKLQHRLAVRQTHLAKELAEAYVRRPQLDEKVLSPVLELTEIYGQPAKAKKKLKGAEAARFDESKLYVPNLSSRSAFWLCEQGGWSIRGVRQQTERVLQQCKALFDYGILQGNTEPDACIESGLERTLMQLKSAEQGIRQLEDNLVRIERIFAGLLPYLGASTRLDTPWQQPR
jgi:hypothetical protein